MKDLPEISIDTKSGNEVFNINKRNLDFSLKDFWIWSQSNLMENRMRGILAEFIVKKALNIKDKVRIEWDCYDLITKNGIKIEIKSSAYLQSWKQKKYSTISFGIPQTLGDSINPNYDGKYRRWSDFYIFCVLAHKDQKTVDPLNLDQWVFYILGTKVLNEKVPNQKTIKLNSLLKLNPIKCNYKELKEYTFKI